MWDDCRLITRRAWRMSRAAGSRSRGTIGRVRDARRSGARESARALTWIGAVAACSMLVGLGACTGAVDAPTGLSSPSATQPQPSSPRTVVVTVPPVPAGIGLSFIQQRIDEGTRRSQVRVVNGTDHGLNVRSVGIDWPGFPADEQRAPYRIYPQQTVDLRYLLPRAVCTAAAGQAPMRGVVTTRQRRVSRPLAEDGVRFLTRLWTSECATRRLDAAVTIAYGETWRRVDGVDGPVLRGSLVLTRPPESRGRETVRVAQVDGSVLFDLRLAGPRDERGLPAGQAEAAVPVVIREGGRCDPHSGSQSTQTFLFRAFLRLGEGEPVSRLIKPSLALQQRLLAFRDRVCSGVS